MSKVETSKFLYELFKIGIYFIKALSMMVNCFYSGSTVLGQNEKVCKNECKRINVRFPIRENDSSFCCGLVGFQQFFTVGFSRFQR